MFSFTVTKPAFLTSRRAPLLAGLALACAGLLAYANSFHGPFVFDDLEAIRDNPTIRHLGTAWSPPPGALPVSGRPVANFSLALNYAAGGLGVGGYHAVNLLIHLLAGLTLFGLLRRTLPPGAAVLGWAVALLWVVHPLQTEAVSYVAQRAESLMGLCYLLTLYGFARGAAGAATPGAPGWLGVSWAACLLGMATKEVMVSAPLLVLLYDRTFVSGSFRAGWERHRRYYVGLGATWLVLAGCVGSAGLTRGGTSGLAIRPAWGSYWLTQGEAVVRYLRLSFWPSPLVFYYETTPLQHRGALLAWAGVVLLLAAGTVWALWRRPAAGFLGVGFFAILAPTSLVPNAIQPLAEHRMYLALAAVLAGAVLGLASLAGKKAGLAVCGVAAVGFTAATVRRNVLYQTSEGLWADTVAKRPENPFARNNLGEALAEQGRLPEAEAQYRASLRIDPGPASIYAHMNLGDVLDRMGRFPEAIAAGRESVRLEPDWVGVHTGLADALVHAGQLPEAQAEYERALRLRPGFPRAENGLGVVLFRTGRAAAAAEHFQSALRANPTYAEAEGNLGAALFSLHRGPEAIAAYGRALQLAPDNAEIHLSLGNALYQASRPADAVREYEAALRLRAGSAEDYDHYGILLAETGRLDEAAAQFRAALRLAPASAAAQDHLRSVEAEARRRSPALPAR